MKRNGRLKAPLLGLLLLLSATVPSSAAEFLEFYKLGLTAIEQGKWSEAAEYMRAAIERQPDAKGRVTKSLFFRRYVPHFYLGKALYQSGDCPGALDAWGQAEAQGVVARSPEYAEMQAGLAACRQRQADLEFARREAEHLIDSAAAAAKACTAGFDRLAALGAETSVLGEQRREAEIKLRSARSMLDGSGARLEEVERAAAMAAEARDRFTAIEREAEQRHVALRSQVAELRGRVAAAVAGAREALQQSEFLRPFPPGVAKRRAELEQALRKGEALEDDAEVDRLLDLQAELTSAVVNLRGAIAPPPSGLTSAAEAYLRGDYGAVVAILDQAEFSSPRIASHAHLLHAASLYALYQAGGAADLEMLSQARQEVLACRAADPSRVPPPAIFSPRFIAFFESQSAGDAEPAGEARSDESAKSGAK